jgi:uncharacterized membrane protein
MVLEMKVPHAAGIEALGPIMPVFLSYLLSFLYVGIYWNNHHHMLHTVQHVSGAMLWANLHLLFWLSLFPFATGWMGENHFAPWPTALYGVVLLMASVAYMILQTLIVTAEGGQALLKRAIGRDWKGKLSSIGYIIGIGLSLSWPCLAQTLYVLVALMWLVPDRRIERLLSKQTTRASNT